MNSTLTATPARMGRPAVTLDGNPLVKKRTAPEATDDGASQESRERAQKKLLAQAAKENFIWEVAKALESALVKNQTATGTVRKELDDATFVEDLATGVGTKSECVRAAYRRAAERMQDARKSGRLLDLIRQHVSYDAACVLIDGAVPAPKLPV